MPLLSTLTEKTTMVGTEETYLDDSGTDKRGKLSNILAYIVANFGAVFNKVTITAPASSATLTIANGKTLTVNNTVTLAGTDGNTHTLPSTNSTTLASLTGVENAYKALDLSSGSGLFKASFTVTGCGCVRVVADCNKWSFRGVVVVRHDLDVGVAINCDVATFEDAVGGQYAELFSLRPFHPFANGCTLAPPFLCLLWCHLQCR